jgi:hypothetical protein
LRTLFCYADRRTIGRPRIFLSFATIFAPCLLKYSDLTDRKADYAAMVENRYRSIFHSPASPADAFGAAIGEMRAWLGLKRYDLAAFDSGDSRIAPGGVHISDMCDIRPIPN